MIFFDTQEGGNDKFNAFLEQKGVSKTTMIPRKYQTPEAELYRERLRAIVEGREPPTELPRRASNASSSSNHMSSASSASAGHTSDLEPIPGETQEQYIARQRRLNEEARFRVQNKFGGGKMQGFGSDPNYDPNKASFGGGVDVGQVLGVVGKFGSQVQVRRQMGDPSSYVIVSWLINLFVAC